MSILSSVAKATIALTLAAASVSASAAVVTYTSPTLFNGTVFKPGTDTFSSLPQGALGSPLNRTAGQYGYTASGTGSLYTSGTPADPWLSTDLSGDRILFNGFAPGVRAIGGFFFGSDVTGAFLAGQTLTLTALDSLGASAVQTLINATEASFAGFASNADLVSLTVTIGSLGAFATVDDLVIAQVPEPLLPALLLIGGAAFLVGRRRTPATTTA